MKRSTIAILIATAVAFGTTTVVSAQKGHGPKAKTNTTAPKAQGGPKVQTQGPKAASAPKVHAQGPKATGGSKAIAQGPKATGGSKTVAQGPKVKTTTHGGGNKTRAATTTATGTANASAKKTKGTAVATTGTSFGTTIGTTVPLTKVQQKLHSNTNLASKLQGRLPAGTNLMRAAEGFRNLGQFVAAVNVSNNLGLPFRQVKRRMVDDGMSLGQTIQDLRPRVDATTEVRRAETDANLIITTTEAETAMKTKKGRG